MGKMPFQPGGGRLHNFCYPTGRGRVGSNQSEQKQEPIYKGQQQSGFEVLQELDKDADPRLKFGDPIV